MTEFSIGDATGTYDAGVIVMPDGRWIGVEDIKYLTVRQDTSGPALPELLDTLRGALPASRRLAMPLRLAVSTVRAGLGAIEDELSIRGGDRVTVELGLNDGSTIVTRMPPDLAATIDRDRDVVLAALTRSAPAVQPIPSEATSEGPAAALTSIFRYEKRNGRLRRVGDADKAI